MIVAVGLYALVAFNVIQRKREIGVRIALGASPRSVVGLVFTPAAVLAICGVAASLILTSAAAPRISAILYEVDPYDLTVLMPAAAIVLVVTTSAALIPSSRAARTDPATLLREQ